VQLCKWQRKKRIATASDRSGQVISYKRNQLAEAIACIFDPHCQEPPSELRTRIKRLLELDRSIDRDLRSKHAEEANFAFFSDKPPGMGADISLSKYEVFALLNG
jgi:hypothetical protein